MRSQTFGQVPLTAARSASVEQSIALAAAVMVPCFRMILALISCQFLGNAFICYLQSYKFCKSAQAKNVFYHKFCMSITSKTKTPMMTPDARQRQREHFDKTMSVTGYTVEGLAERYGKKSLRRYYRGEQPITNETWRAFEDLQAMATLSGTEALVASHPTRNPAAFAGDTAASWVREVTATRMPPHYAPAVDRPPLINRDAIAGTNSAAISPSDYSRAVYLLGILFDQSPAHFHAALNLMEILAQSKK